MKNLTPRATRRGSPLGTPHRLWPAVCGAASPLNKLAGTATRTHDCSSPGKDARETVRAVLSAGAAPPRRTPMDTLHPHCAGLDVHKDTVVACVRHQPPRGRARTEVRTFATHTAGLLELADW